MTTAPSPLYQPNNESKLVKVLIAPVAERIEELERISREPEQQIYYAQIFDNALTREVDASNDRMLRLRRLRLIWGILSALLLIALSVSLVLHVSYEPAAALLACSTGLFVVFYMKVGDAKR